MYRPPYNPHTPASQRDAAFSNIFGTAPSGRSQTMTSQSSTSPLSGRSQTMSSQLGMSGYTSSSRQQQQGYPPNGYNQQAPPNAYQHPQSNPNSRGQYQPQNLPQPMHPERRPYAQPMRVQPHGAPPSNPNMSKPAPHRYHPPPPALNADPYRSRSMVATYSPTGGPSGPQFSRPGARPPGPHMSRTTAQGRIVPERHDERTMSLTTYPHDRDFSQTASGRVIPHRRKDSQESQYSQTSHYRQQPEQQRFNSMPARENNYVSKQRTPSSASTSSSITAFSPSRPPSIKSSLTDSTLVSKPSMNNSGPGNGNSGAAAIPAKRTPLVYPALLSRVANAMRERIIVGDRVKNELAYKSAFTGAEAVDVISYIIKTSDRSLALLLGRALDAQKFFHDVTYDHRLRDSQMEVYQFKDGLLDDDNDVNGVFTLLTECYSPTCTPKQLCYSIACPRRLEQQARLNMQPRPGLKREESRSSLHGDDDKEQKLWIHTVPKEIAESVSEKEKKRQEVICEAIYTERDFVKDLEYLRDFWMKPLRSTNPQNPSPIPEHRRERFIRTVFGNVLEVHSVNSRLAEALTRRQQQSPIVHNIGDIFLEFVPLFEPFIKYGSNQLYGKYEFEKEKAANPNFARFVEETERMKESRKLELNGYLTKPTTRLARYPLLLEAVMKPTTDDNPDKKDLPKATELIREFLTRVNIESGKAENHFNLMQLNEQLIFRPGEHVDLKLTEEGRQLIFKGNLKKSASQEGGGDIQAFLFDHALLLVRIKSVNKREEYRVYRKPIPLELLVIAQMEEVLPKAGVAKRPSSSLIPGTKTIKNIPNDFNSKEKGYPITFQHLGKRGYTVPLFASSVVSRRKWIEHIEAQQSVLRERSSIFTRTILCDDFFNAGNRVSCLVPIDGGRKLVYGTDSGIYVSERKPREGASAVPKKVIEVNKVDQIDVLEEFSILLLLSEKTLMSVPVEGLDPNDTTLANKRPKKVAGHTNFFKAGVCLGRVLVCCVRSSSLSSTVKVYEPLDTLARGKGRPAFRGLLRGGQDTLKAFKEFYIPSESTSIHFLKSKLCVGCSKGFEVVSLETLEAQSLLDPADTSLELFQRKENVKPIAIYRLNGEFLLNYSDFSFFVNRNGWRARPDWQIAWEGQPTAFAFSYPYLLAFEPSFIEIRNVETGGLVHIVTGKNIRLLHESTREILYAYEDEGSGDDVIASLDFWSRQKS
ncbi:CNH-domain-containing protein [Choiromyces venosus 120613-1]|uniref:CNH-domain-containing protein n=1 Tax=Choiromyces venosus 120613-1 TaxID=1336337 RepID=A0A3N4K6W8_9PEZI|nr:CNH-domain-containing protein [Choiromyces venosus 120613-1]